MASAQGIRAGKAYVEVGADLNPLERALKNIESRFKNVGAFTSNIGKNFATVGASITALGATISAPFIAATAQFTEYGGALDDASQRTGVGAEALSELGWAAQMSGTDLATVEKSISKLQKGITGAANRAKLMQKAFADLGFSAEYLAKLSPEQQFLEVGKAIGKIADPTQRAAKAMEVFGKSGTALLPLLTADIDALRKEAQELGLTLSDVDAANAASLGDAFDRVKKAISGIGNQIGAAIAEPLEKIANITAKVIAGVTGWVKRNRELVQTIAAIAAGVFIIGSAVTVAGIAFIGLGATIGAIGTVIGSIVGIASAVFSAVASAVAFVLTPVGLLTAAVVGLGAYITFAALTSTGSLTKLSEMFGSLGGTAVEAWRGIVAALSTGDLELAGQIAFTALEVAWLTVTNTIQQVWANVSTFFVNTWLSAVQSVVQIGAAIYFGVAKYWDLLTTALIVGFDGAFTYITGAIDSIQTAIAKAIIKAQEFFGLFSAEQSLQIQASLDSDLQQRANNRANGLEDRTANRAAGLEERDTQRRSTAKQFSDTLAEDFKRREARVDNSGLTAAQKRLEELKLSLAEKSAAAQEKAAAAQEGAGKVAQGQEAATAVLQQTSAGSVGSFVGGVAANIKGGGISDVLEEASKATADNTAKLTEQMQQLIEEGGLE